MVLNYSLLQNGFPPLIIKKETKSKYIEFLGNQDVDGFFHFAEELLMKEERIIQVFQNMKKEENNFLKYNKHQK